MPIIGALGRGMALALWLYRITVMTKCRLVIEVPAKLALMPPEELDTYVRAHWTEWQDKWRRIGRSEPADAILRVDGGQPMYLLARGSRHYLVAEATAVPFDAAA